MKVIRLSKKEARKKLGKDYIRVLLTTSVKIDNNVVTGWAHRFHTIIDDGDYIKLYLEEMARKTIEESGCSPYRLLNHKGEALETEVIDED